ncbi:MAG: penicillin-binding protein 2 [Patescibacteria group bacterium]
MKKENPFFITENIDTGQKGSLRWVEESDPADIFSGQQKEFLGLSLSQKKLKIFIGLVLLGLSILLIKSFYLQIIRGENYFFLAENNRVRTKYVKAHRGIMYDRNGKVLVQNLFGFSLFITPADLPKKAAEKSEVLSKVAAIFNVQPEEIEAKIKEASKFYFEPVIIKTGIGYEPAMVLKIYSSDLPGVNLEIDSWRNYIGGEALSHIMGYVGKISAKEYEKKRPDYLLSDNIGKTGLEQYYENDLRGEMGKKQVEVDALGQEKKIISQTPFTPGNDLVLTIDEELQNKIYSVLKERLGDKKSGAVIVSNPQNGEILALVDYPAYDNNLFSLGIESDKYQVLLNDFRNPLFTRSIFGEYPSGSTVKQIIAAAALQEGVITPNTSINSVGGIKVDKWFFPDWKAGGHGLTNVYQALAWSINTFFYYIGGGYGDFKGLGVDRLTKYMRLFGLGEKLGIDLPGERAGFIPSKDWKEKEKKEPWYIGDTYHLSIGQGDLLVTPLQVNSYNSIIANGGILYRPHLVKAEIQPASTQRGEPDRSQKLLPIEIIRKNMVDLKNIEVVRQGMRQAVTYGSARNLNDLPVEVAGKTGTAQWNSVKPNHAWFNGFAPFNNPTFSITVLVEEGGEGSSIAAPIAKEIINYWFGKK